MRQDVATYLLLAQVEKENSPEGVLQTMLKARNVQVRKSRKNHNSLREVHTIRISLIDRISFFIFYIINHFIFYLILYQYLSPLLTFLYHIW